MDYISNMKVEWDENKSEACYRERGFDFAYAALAFADPERIAQQDTRYIYGEDRYQMIGRIDCRLFVLVYTPRGDVVRIISARKANLREVKRYEDRSHED